MSKNKSIYNLFFFVNPRINLLLQNIKKIIKICRIVKIINKIVSINGLSCVNGKINIFKANEAKDGTIIEKNANPQEIIPKVVTLFLVLKLRINKYRFEEIRKSKGIRISILLVAK